MIARMQQWLCLSLLAAAMTWTTWGLSRHDALWVLAGVMLIPLMHASLLALEFVWMRWANLSDRAPRASLGQVLHAWWGEVRIAAQVFGWRQPFRSRRWPDRLSHADRGRAGVVLVHGYLCNRGLWNTWMRRLTQLQIPYIAVTLEPAFGELDGYLPQIERAVRQLEEVTDVPPLVIGHSMGGLACRAWWAWHGQPGRVRRILTIGSPHHGTRTALLGLGRNALQMRPGSAWLAALKASEADRDLPITSFYSHCDNVVFPAMTACLPGADNRHLASVAHVRMVEHPEVWAEAMRLLEASQSRNA